MTPVTLDDATRPLGTHPVMYSAHSEDTVPLISSLTLNPEGRTWEACSAADCLLWPSDPNLLQGWSYFPIQEVSFHYES